MITQLTGFLNVPDKSFGQFINGWQIAHGTEGIHVCAYRVNDVVDSLLDDDRIGTGNRKLVRETDLSHQSIGFISDIVILAQDPSAAGGFSDNGSMVIRYLQAFCQHVIWPVL